MPPNKQSNSGPVRESAHKKTLVPSADFEQAVKSESGGERTPFKRTEIDVDSIYPKPTHSVHDNNSMNTRSAVSQEEFNKPIYARTLSLRFYAIATSILGIISFFTIQGAKELFYYPSLLVVVGYITLAIPLICMPFFLTARRMPVVKVALWVMLLNYGANCLLTYGDIVAGGLVTDLFNGFLVVPIFETVLLVWTIQVLREVNVLLDRN